MIKGMQENAKEEKPALLDYVDERGLEGARRAQWEKDRMVLSQYVDERGIIEARRANKEKHKLLNSRRPRMVLTDGPEPSGDESESDSKAYDDGVIYVEE